MIVSQPVEGQVVDDPAVGIAEDGILDLAEGEGGRVVGGQSLHRGEGSRAADFELAHVTDVEEPDIRANAAVLLDDAGVLHGHVPAAEGNHLGAGGDVDVAQGRALERSRGVRHGNSIILIDGHRGCNGNCAPTRI